MTSPQELQTTLAAEHAAVYVYAVLGARSSASTSPRTAALLRSAYDVHRGRRDQLRSEIAALGATPVTAAPAYAVDARRRTTAHLLAVARDTERRCTEVYAQQVAGTSGEQRSWAVSAQVDAAVRLVALGDAPQPYPGLPEL